MSKFALKESELETDLDKWLYSLKYSGGMNHPPLYEQEPIFKSFFNTAEYTNLSKEDKKMYDLKLKNYWDFHLIRDTELEEKLNQGKEEKALQIAKNLKVKGITLIEIQELTGLSIDEIEKL